MIDKEIERFLDELYLTILAASFSFDIWFFLREKGNIKRYSNVMRFYPLFFNSTRVAHFISIFIHLYRLLETRKDTISFPNLVKMTLDKSLLGKVKIEKLKDSIKKIKPFWVNISNIRSYTIVHINKDIDSNQLFNNFRITPNEIKDFIEKSKELYYDFCKVLNIENKCLNFKAVFDTKRMLDNLKKLQEKGIALTID